MEPNKFLGVAIDPRTKDEKSRDWSSDEVAMSSPIQWIEKKPSEWKFFSRRDQNGSSSCMGQSGVKMLGIENVEEENTYVELSAKPIYFHRENKPGLGMWQQNCLSLLCKPLACLESQLPSQKMHEAEINAEYVVSPEEADIAEKYRAGGYAFIPLDIDKVAQIVSQKKGVQIIIFFTADEYWNGTNRPKVLHPKLKKEDDEALRHGVCVTDYTLYKGQKALVFEDSAVLNGETGQRVITEDFFKTRCYGAGYLLALSNDHSVIEKPHYHFYKAMTFGMRNLDVKALQDILKYEGFFDSGIPSTGYFGSITAQALKDWQISHAILDFQNEMNMTKIRFGAKCINLMNAIYL